MQGFVTHASFGTFLKQFKLSWAEIFFETVGDSVFPFWRAADRSRRCNTNLKLRTKRSRIRREYKSEKRMRSNKTAKETENQRRV